MGFAEEYCGLEQKFIKRVKDDNKEGFGHAHYLPNIAPKDKVDFVLVAMEPSINRGWKDHSADCPAVECESRNFVNSIEDFILHYCVRRYLCKGNETKSYHITDLAKGQMSAGQAEHKRNERWEQWYPLLECELQIVAPEAPVISIGEKVERFLNTKKLKNHVGRVVHYAKRASKAHRKEANNCPREYKKFDNSFTASDLEGVVREILGAMPGYNPAEKILNDLQNGNPFSGSRKELAFTYKVKFERLVDKGCMCPYDRYTPTWRQT